MGQLDYEAGGLSWDMWDSLTIEQLESGTAGLMLDIWDIWTVLGHVAKLDYWAVGLSDSWVA